MYDLQHQINATLRKGSSLDDAKKAIIMVHGRGASPEDILTLTPHLQVDGFAQLAPRATASTWYPYSFLAPPEQNEPGLSSALQLLGQLVDQCIEAGIATEHLYLLGFSQGACLTLEYAARNALRYGGVFALSGGLIGDQLEANRYQGDFGGTPIFLGCSDVDPHIPLTRVEESATQLTQMGASVTKNIYPNMPHTIIQEEIDVVNKLLSSNH